MSALFKKLLALIMGILCLTLTVIIILVSYETTHYSIRDYQKKGEAISASITDIATDLILNQNPATIQGVLNLYQNIDGVAYIIVRDNTQDVLAHTLIPAISKPLHAFYDTVRFDELHSQQTQTVHLESLGRIYEISTPILDGEIGYLHVGMALDPVYRLLIYRIALLCLVGLLMFGLSIFWIRRFAQTISQPLLSLTTYAKGLSEHHFESVHPLQAQIKTVSKTLDNELGTLAAAFIQLEDDMIVYIKDLEKTVKEKQQMEADVQIARQIQQHMLPQCPLEGNLLFVEGTMQAAKDVGGDFYDYFEKENGDLVFMIGDVSGKGVPAALFMAVTMTYLKAIAQELSSPSQILNKANSQIAKSNKDQLFVTCFFGVIRKDTAELSYVNAGHPAPYLISQALIPQADQDKLTELPLTQGIPLGVLEEFDYQEATFKLSSSDRLFLFTDGITEAENAAKEFYEDTRLKALLSIESFKTSTDLIDAVVKSVKEFEATAAQSDDITALCVTVS